MTEIKKRNVAVVIVLSVVAYGIYAIYWQVCLVNDMNEVKEDESAKSEIIVLLSSIVTCSIYWLYWVFKTGECIDSAKAVGGTPTLDRRSVYPLLSIFGLSIVAIAILQSDLNNLAAKNYDDFEV